MNKKDLCTEDRDLNRSINKRSLNKKDLLLISEDPRGLVEAQNLSRIPPPNAIQRKFA
jgi:hypothetical protein